MVFNRHSYISQLPLNGGKRYQLAAKSVRIFSNTHHMENQKKELHRVTATAIIHKDGKYLIVKRNSDRRSFS